MTKAREKSKHRFVILRILEIFGVGLTKLINIQILLNKVSHRFLLTAMLFTGWNSTIKSNYELSKVNILLTTVWYCKWMQTLATLCWILSKHAQIFELFSSKHVQNGWWVRLILKLGLFEHALLLSFISFTTVHAKSPKLVSDFIKTLNWNSTVKNN